MNSTEFRASIGQRYQGKVSRRSDVERIARCDLKGKVRGYEQVARLKYRV
jgi:hypothetical protein